MSEAAPNTLTRVSRTKVDRQGRIVIPAEYRHALGIEEGMVVTMRIVDGELRVITLKQAVLRVQEMAKQYTTPGRSMADELIAERRAEAARE